MQLPASAELVRRLDVVPRTGSTNDDLVAAAHDWPAPGVLVTDHQTAGRGRLGRSWGAEAGDSLAISVLLRPSGPRAEWGWLSLAAGAAMTRALRSLGVAAEAKWPNDVLIGGRKVCGVLAQALPDGSGVVVGAGVNHAADEDRLPVATATSLRIEGGPTEPDTVVAAYLRELLALAAAFDEGGGAAVRAAVIGANGTIGRRVRVTLPDGSAVVGDAVGIDEDGRVEVRQASISQPTAIASGDVEHLRYE